MMLILKVVCGFCNRSYSKANSFRRHIRRKHRNETIEANDNGEENHQIQDAIIDNTDNSVRQVSPFLKNPVKLARMLSTK